MEFKGTKGEWIVVDKNTNGTNGFEIQFGSDGECVTDHVYTKEDALLISKAPELFEILSLILEEEGLNQIVHSNIIHQAKRIIKESTSI